MKKDYLWDKSGATDPEIERLENALAMFRYQEAEPPALPAKIVPFERKAPRGFFRWAFPSMAFAALAMIAVGVWFQISSGKIEIANDLPEKKIIAPPVDERNFDEISQMPPDDSAIEKVEIPKRTANQKSIKVKKNVPANARRDRTIARNINAGKPSVKLTKDEKYAYDQLMLALSITGSKLKIVEDKIYGAEESKAILENGR